MSIASRINAIEEHLTDDYSVLELAGADLTNVDKNIVNLSPTWKERLLYFINNGTDVVWNNWDKVEGEGESLSLNNTVEAKMEIELKGNTYQSNESDNLFDKSSPNVIDATLNSSTQKIETNSHYKIVYISCIPNTTYTVSKVASGYLDVAYTYTTPSDNVDYHGRITSSDTKTATITTGSSASYLVVRFYRDNDTLTPQQILDSLVIKATTNVPSPDYPQDIQVVSGDNIIEICNKNLFDKNREIYSSYTSSIPTALSNYKSTGKYAKGYINYTNSSINSDNRFQTVFINCMENTTYTISFSSNKEISTLCYLDNEGNIVGYGKNYWSTFTTFTFTTSSNSKYIAIGVNSTDIDTLQVEIGNATEYITNQHQTHLISLPVENLFNKNNPNVLNAYINASGVITSVNNDRTIWLKINQNTNYAFQMTQKALSTATSTDDIRIALFTNQPEINSTGTIVYSQARATSTSDYYFEYSFNSGNNSYVAIKILNVSKTDYDSSIDTIQLEKGSKANSYTPYGTTPIELCKIGDYQDKIAKSTGKNLFDYNLFETFATDIKTISLTLKPNTTYTMSTNLPITSGSTNLFFKLPDDSYSGSTNGVSPTSSRTLTTDSTGVVNIGYRNYNSGISGNLKTDYWYMLNKGTTALPYEPYGKVWYLNKQIGKVVLDGSENWSYDTSGVTGIISSSIQISDMLSGNYLDGLTTYFHNDKSGKAKNSIRFGANNKYIYLYLDETEYTSANDVKAFLSTHNTEVYYPLATPTYTEITDTTLLSQLNALGNANSYNEQTNINQDNNDLASILSVSALEEM